MNVTVTAEAIPSHASCDNEIVSIPDRGRIDTVTRPLIVKVGLIKEYLLKMLKGTCYASFWTS